LEAALAAPSELKRRLHQMADRPPIRSDRCVSSICSAIESGQSRLWVERVDLAGRAIHKQEYRMLGSCHEMRLLWRKHVRGGRGFSITGSHAVREKPISGK